MGGAVLQRLYADGLRHARRLAHEPHEKPHEYVPGCIPSPVRSICPEQRSAFRGW